MSLSGWITKRLNAPFERQAGYERRRAESDRHWHEIEAARAERDAATIARQERRAADPDRCGNCVCYQVEITLGGTGNEIMVCKRFPAVEAKNAHDWCGEHDRRDDA